MLNKHDDQLTHQYLHIYVVYLNKDDLPETINLTIQTLSQQDLQQSIKTWSWTRRKKHYESEACQVYHQAAHAQQPLEAKLVNPGENGMQGQMPAHNSNWVME